MVNPLFGVDPTKHATWIDAALGSFSSNTVDVMMKKQNTEAFLRRASEVTTRAVAETRLHIQQAQEEAVRLTGVPFR